VFHVSVRLLISPCNFFFTYLLYYRLRKLRHIHVKEGERVEEQSRLQRLIKAIAEEIKACGSDLNFYLDRKFICKSLPIQ